MFQIEKNRFRNTVVILGILVLFIFSTGLISNVKCQIGVKEGDWAKYTVTYDMPQGAQPPPSTIPQWMKMEIIKIEGTSVTVCTTMHMANGSEINQTSTFEITSTNASGIIPNNLKVGDSINMPGYGMITIAGEETRVYAGASRTVLYANISQYGTETTYYWDKETGLPVEMISTTSGPSGTMTMGFKLTETNIWASEPSRLPLDPMLFYILITVVIVAVVGIIVAVAIRRRKKIPAEEETDETLSEAASET